MKTHQRTSVSLYPLGDSLRGDNEVLTFVWVIYPWSYTDVDVKLHAEVMAMNVSSCIKSVTLTFDL